MNCGVLLFLGLEARYFSRARLKGEVVSCGGALAGGIIEGTISNRYVVRVRCPINRVRQPPYLRSGDPTRNFAL
jgi:hypothetical protein